MRKTTNILSPKYLSNINTVGSPSGRIKDMGMAIFNKDLEIKRNIEQINTNIKLYYPDKILLSLVSEFSKKPDLKNIKEFLNILTPEKKHLPNIVNELVRETNRLISLKTRKSKSKKT